MVAINMYKVVYPNGKECLLEKQVDRQVTIWGTESKFNHSRIAWFKLSSALKALKESGAIVTKVKQGEMS